MSEELEVLKIVTERLDQAKIVYMISGSIAANLYSVPRMTRDIDIVMGQRQLFGSAAERCAKYFAYGKKFEYKTH